MANISQATVKRLEVAMANQGAAVELTDKINATIAVGSQAAAVAALTDSGGGASANGTIELVTAPTAASAATATNPAAPTAYTAHASGATTVTSNAATDLDTTAAALATLRGEVATYETAISALIVDVADLRSRQGEDRTAIIALTDAVKELSTKTNAVISSLKTATLMAT